MGKTAADGEDNCGSPLAVVDTVKEQAEKLTGQIIPRDNVKLLYGALTDFEQNIGRWYTRGPQDRICLQAHAVFTLCVPGGKASRARTAVERLFDARIIPANWKRADRDCAAWRALFPAGPEKRIADLIRSHVRFHNAKAKNIVFMLQDWERFQVNTGLLQFQGIATVREYLVENISGFGYKAAAHFIRNAGLGMGLEALPIIDTHIYKALAQVFNYRPAKFTHKTYIKAEELFLGWARELKVPILLLDAALWCAYANNWDLSQSDFDNFAPLWHR